MGCTTKLGNGVAIPTDPTHPGGALTGTCTTAAGTAVCSSGVCDTTTNECGHANGTGTCTIATGPMICVSGVCSVDGTCEPAGGCNVDADCHNGDWCDEAINTCKAQLSNGTPIPTDGGHTNPTLTGACSAAAGLLVCVSGVCDMTSNECGYGSGDGPCTAENGSVVCQSGLCATNGTCQPTVPCTMDSQCATAQWCDESAGFCVATLSNGQPIPTDTGHTNPTLNGMCTTAAGTLVCTSKVCDTNDNECGYANGDGPCTVATGPMVCRSGSCSTSGTCQPSSGCNVNSDCPNPSDPVCNPTTHICGPATDGGVNDGGGTSDGSTFGDGSTTGDSGSGDGSTGPGQGTENDQGGYIEGGGCASEVAGHARAPFSSSVLAGAGVIGLLVSRRRKRRPVTTA